MNADHQAKSLPVNVSILRGASWLHSQQDGSTYVNPRPERRTTCLYHYHVSLGSTRFVRRLL